MYLWPVKYRNSMKSTHKTHACKTKTNENTSKIMLAMSIVNEGPQGRSIDAAPMALAMASFKPRPGGDCGFEMKLCSLLIGYFNNTDGGRS